MSTPRTALVERVLSGPGRASAEQRKAAFANDGVKGDAVRALVDKVAHHAYKITDEDIAAVKSAGLSEDQIFEVAVCAAAGQASRLVDTAFAALAEATK